MRWIENANKKTVHFDGAIVLKPLQSTFVILGYGAILVNLLFFIIYLLMLLLRQKQPIPKWQIWTNFLFFVIQFVYFFFYN